jgi:DNA-binding MarR family transcriptional regulator
MKLRVATDQPSSPADDVPVLAGAPLLIDLARQAQKMRAIVARMFPRDVLKDSAWDMLLELFVATQEFRVLCVKQLILVSGETSTSALRRIDRLEETGMIRRRGDAADHRRVTVEMTLKGEEAMTAMLRSLILDPTTRTGNGTGDIRRVN